MKALWLLAVLALSMAFALASPAAPPKAGAASQSTRTLPPGTDPNPSFDRGPSAIIFPPQSIPLRFDHKAHLGMGLGLSCTSCHPGGKTSRQVHDTLLPKGTTCDTCHGTSHADTFAVKGGASGLSACATCHEGYKAEDGNRVARVNLPAANLTFSHAAHATRNIGCPQCHGDVSQVTKATRAELPRMRGCLRCHTEGEAGGDAKAACETCHLRGGAKEGGRLQVTFGGGKLVPPRWMRNAGHDLGFMQRHKMVAANDSQFCANCHKEEFCTDCHDGRVRPRNIHPNDYISMHAVEARQASEKCNSCHREQSFCLQCHQRLGVAMSGPGGVREPGRFHPPKAIWSDLPRRPGHHTQEAVRNLDACVSCHIERDCVACHGARGVGGRFSPHPAGFASQCSSLMARNPRPCLVCHEPSSADLARCR